MINIKQISKSYPTNRKQLVLNDISLTIPVNKMTCIVGSNGAGKSSLLMAIGRLLSIDQGIITVNNLDVNQTSSDIIAKHLAILRQKNNFEYKITVAELVMFGRFPYHKGKPTIEDYKIVDKTLEFLDITTLKTNYINELSGGQQQRALIAMILAQETPYILLDEPLSSLDIKAQYEMMKLLKLFTETLNKTVVSVMHDINLVTKYADYVIGLKQGKVIAQGTVTEVINTEVIKQIFDIDIEVITYKNHPLCVF